MTTENYTVLSIAVASVVMLIVLKVIGEDRVNRFFDWVLEGLSYQFQRLAEWRPWKR